jgi:hypothetical protein
MNYSNSFSSKDPFTTETFQEFKEFALSSLKMKLGTEAQKHDTYLFLLNYSLTPENFCQYAFTLKNRISSHITNSSEIQSYIDSLINYLESTFSSSKPIQLISIRSELPIKNLSSSYEPDLFSFEIFEEFVKSASYFLNLKLGEDSSTFFSLLFLIKYSSTPEEFLQHVNSLKSSIPSFIPNSSELQSYIDSLIQYSKSKFLTQQSINFMQDKIPSINPSHSSISFTSQTEFDQNIKKNHSQPQISDEKFEFHQQHKADHSLSYNSHFNQKEIPKFYFTPPHINEIPSKISFLFPNQNPNISFNQENTENNIQISGSSNNHSMFPIISPIFIDDHNIFEEQIFSELNQLNILYSSESRNTFLFQIVKIFKKIILSILPNYSQTSNKISISKFEQIIFNQINQLNKIYQNQQSSFNQLQQILGEYFGDEIGSEKEIIQKYDEKFYTIQQNLYFSINLFSSSKQSNNEIFSLSKVLSNQSQFINTSLNSILALFNSNIPQHSFISNQISFLNKYISNIQTKLTNCLNILDSSNISKFPIFLQIGSIFSKVQSN